MPWTTGTANGHAALLDALKDWITGPALGAQAWTAKRHTPGDELILQGPGLAGTDQILVGAKCYQSAIDDYYNWRLQGFAGWDTAQPFASQPGAMPTSALLNLWNQPITYWFVANGRRLIVVAKVSSLYFAAYLGFLLPYATPGQWPYPLVVGGSFSYYGPDPTALGATNRWGNSGNRNFWNSNQSETLSLRRISGIWEGYNSNQSDYYGKRYVWPTYQNPTRAFTNLDGSYTLFPFQLYNAAEPSLLGELEGIRWVTGWGNAAENTITADGDTWLVIPNVSQNGLADFAAVRLA